MSDGLLLVMCVLGSYRLARLVTVDTLLSPLRNWFLRRSGTVMETFADLLTCPWCFGVHVSAVLVAAVWASIGLPLPALWFAAVPGGQALLASIDARLNVDE